MSMKTIQENQFFQTSEYPLAASLICYGYAIECLDRSNKDRVEFCFMRSKEVEKIIEEFWKGTLMVNAIAFHNALKLLKARLRNDF